ncbi:MAG TPA: hypothetical protein VF813_07555 [Anaerolineaceae bacterium]
MQTGSSTRKIPGGKLVRVDVRAGSRVEWVKITGDFFLHPEETLDQIEACLTGAGIPLDQPGLTQCIEACLRENQAELLGASPADIVSVLQEAVG